MKITEEIKSIFKDSKEWIELEIEYARLTITEKVTLLLSALVLGAVCLMMFIVVMILLSFALVDVFKLFMAPGLAYLSVAGVIVLLILIVYLLRRQILEDPLARLISKIFLDVKSLSNKK